MESTDVLYAPGSPYATGENYSNPANTMSSPEVERPLPKEVKIRNVSRMYNEVQSHLRTGKYVANFDEKFDGLDLLNRTAFPLLLKLNRNETLQEAELESIRQLNESFLYHYGVQGEEYNLWQAYNTLRDTLHQAVPPFTEFMQRYRDEVVRKSHRLARNGDGQTYTDYTSQRLPRITSGPNTQLLAGVLDTKTVPLQEGHMLQDATLEERAYVGYGSEAFQRLQSRWWERMPTAREGETFARTLPEILPFTRVEEVQSFREAGASAVQTVQEVHEHSTATADTEALSEEDIFQARLNFGMAMLRGDLWHSNRTQNAYVDFIDAASHFGIADAPTDIRYDHVSEDFLTALQELLQQSRQNGEEWSPSSWDRRWQAAGMEGNAPTGDEVGLAWDSLLGALDSELSQNREQLQIKTIQRRIIESFGRRIGGIVLGEEALPGWLEDPRNGANLFRLAHSLVRDGLSDDNRNPQLLQKVFGVERVDIQAIQAENFRYASLWFEAVREEEGFDYNDRNTRENPKLNDEAFVAQVNTILPNEGENYLAYAREYVAALSRDDFSWTRDSLPYFVPSFRMSSEGNAVSGEEQETLDDNLDRLLKLYAADSAGATPESKYHLLSDVTNREVAYPLIRDSQRAYDQQQERDYIRKVERVFEDVATSMPHIVAQLQVRVTPWERLQEQGTNGAQKIIPELEWLSEVMAKYPYEIPIGINEQDAEGATLEQMSKYKKIANFMQHIAFVFPGIEYEAAGTGREIPLLLLPPWVDKKLVALLQQRMSAEDGRRPLVRCITSDNLSSVPDLLREMFSDIGYAESTIGEVTMERTRADTQPMYGIDSFTSIWSGMSEERILWELDKLVGQPERFDEVIAGVVEATIEAKKRKKTKDRLRQQWMDTGVEQLIEERHMKDEQDETRISETSLFMDLARELADAVPKGRAHWSHEAIWQMLPEYLRHYLMDKVPSAQYADWTLHQPLK